MTVARTQRYTVETESAHATNVSRTVTFQLAKGQRDEDYAPLKSHARRRNARGMPMTPQSPTIGAILAAVALRFNVSIIDLVSARRGRSASRPRMLVYWLARHVTLHSLNEIGRAIGNRDHTTILHGIARTEELLRCDQAIAEAAADLRLQFAWEFVA